MTKHDISWWKVNKGVARGILQDRAQRRRMLARMLMLALAMLAAGLWLLDSWLSADAWRFLLWWSACALVTCVVMLFALYDLLAVIREEQRKSR